MNKPHKKERYIISAYYTNICDCMINTYIHNICKINGHVYCIIYVVQYQVNNKISSKIPHCYY